MEIIESINTVKEINQSQNIELLNGNFSATEAADIINSILNVKINFHKLQALSINEGNINDPCKFDNERIQELINEQKISESFFKNSRLQGKKLKINSTIQITIEN